MLFNKLYIFLGKPLVAIFLTILSGVSVFVLGQFIIKLSLEPIVSFKESLGSLSAVCLRNRDKISNVNSSVELQNEMKGIISTIISKRQAIPMYPFFSLILSLPSDERIIESCRILNGVSIKIVKENSQSQAPLNVPITILTELERVSQLLGVRLDFKGI